MGLAVRGRLFGLAVVTAAVVGGVVPLAALAGLTLLAGGLGACEVRSVEVRRPVLRRRAWAALGLDA